MQNDNMAAACITSSLTPAKSPHLDLAMNSATKTMVIPGRLELPEKLPAINPEWHMPREVTMETAPANIVELEPSSNLSRLIPIPIPEEDNVGEDNKSEDQTVKPKIVDRHSGIDEINQSDCDDKDQVGLLFKHLGFEEIDSDSDVYQEQYNLIVTTMVGGRIVMGSEKDWEEDRS
ncbi:hypothetical protein EDD18DRAFT_1110674 [Armillaria luteobubalina]|uniref:Uncharacterized protein n=1 Tax=Armillaria luteobubalina TaxID=153913 RepID=A0AA39PPF9_9AGAR|nr:hypothetical protein EDD18DRAFT_1110674 [Armillaria luteobubalina]